METTLFARTRDFRSCLISDFFNNICAFRPSTEALIAHLKSGAVRTRTVPEIPSRSVPRLPSLRWDPHHAADGRHQAADVVNLGFVLNVIEDPRERTETLRAAWGFARHALCVSVMVQGRVDVRA